MLELTFDSWQHNGEHHNNEFQNLDRPTILLKKKKTTYASIPPLSPRVIIAPVLPQNGKRSIKGSLLTSRFCNVLRPCQRFVTVIRLQLKLKFQRQLTSRKENESK